MSLILPRRFLPPSTLTTVTYQGYTNGAWATATGITLAAGVQEGDLGLLYVSFDGTAAVPSGWTSIDAVDNTPSNYSYFCYKILTSGDASASVTCGSGGANNVALFTYFRGNIPISSVTPYDNTLFYSTWSSQTISAAGQAIPLIVYGANTGRNDADPSFTSESPAFGTTIDIDSGIDDGSIIWGHTIYDAGDTPADHTLNANAGSRPSFGSGVLLLT